MSSVLAGGSLSTIAGALGGGAGGGGLDFAKLLATLGEVGKSFTGDNDKDDDDQLKGVKDFIKSVTGGSSVLGSESLNQKPGFASTDAVSQAPPISEAGLELGSVANRLLGSQLGPPGQGVQLPDIFGRPGGGFGGFGGGGPDLGLGTQLPNFQPTPFPPIFGRQPF